jgi:hypothetical protein
MGWFIIAAILGFLSFWAWRSAPKTEPIRPSEHIISFVETYLSKSLPITIAYIAAGSFGLWLVLFLLDKSYIFNRITDSLGQGTAARLLLGFALGFGLAFVQERRFDSDKVDDTKARVEKRTGEPAVATTPASTPEVTPPSQPPGVDTKSNSEATEESTPANAIIDAGKNTVLAIALAIVFIALAAPHLDNWLSHLTSVKLPFAELQVTSVGTHRGIMADQITFYSDIRSIQYLSEYRTKLHNDLSYIESFELPEKQQDIFVDEEALSELKNSITKMHALSFSFDNLVSPIATCVKSAIDNGMSRDMIRQMLLPLGHALDQIILMEKSLQVSELRSKHQEFWGQLMRIPVDIQPFLKQPQRDECLLLPVAYSYATTGVDYLPADLRIDAFPKIQNYDDISYLYAAALLLTSFLKEEQISLKILDKVRKETKLKIKDYYFLIWASNITINQGTSIDLIIPYLDQMRQTAQTRREVIQRFQNHCASVRYDLSTPVDRCNEQLLGLAQTLGRREREVELRAKNNFAYYVAESLARGEKASEAYQGQAEEYARELFSAVEGRPGQRSNMGIQFDLDQKFNYLDTYAYVLMVLEARKTLPDVNKFKEFVAIFEKAVEQAESQERKSEAIEPIRLYSKTITRSHLASAKELTGQ